MLSNYEAHIIKLFLRLMQDTFYLKNVYSCISLEDSKFIWLTASPHLYDDEELKTLVDNFHKDELSPFFIADAISLDKNYKLYLFFETTEDSFINTENITTLLDILKKLFNLRQMRNRFINISFQNQIGYEDKMSEFIQTFLEEDKLFFLVLDRQNSRIYMNSDLLAILGQDTTQQFISFETLPQLMDHTQLDKLCFEVESLIKNEVGSIINTYTLNINNKTDINLFLTTASGIYRENQILCGFLYFKQDNPLIENILISEINHLGTGSIGSYGFWEYNIADDEIIVCSKTMKMLNLSSAKIAFNINNNQLDDISFQCTIKKELTKYFLAIIDNNLQEFSFTTEIIDVANQRTYYEITGRYVSDNMRLKKIIGHIKDCSNDNEQMSDSFQMQKLQSLGTLAGSVAHDFNNILMATFGYIGLLRSVPQLPAKALEYIDALTSANENAVDIAKRLLKFTRTDTLISEKIELISVLKDAVELLRNLLPPNISVSEEYKVSKAYMIGYKNDIQNAIINIGTNAKDAMPNGGIISIKVTTDFISEVDESFIYSKHFAKGNYIIVTISDTGIGIDNTNAAQIFNPFYTTKRKDKGTGLGLTSVISSLDTNKGMLDLHSIVNFGTTFSLYFPQLIGFENEASRVKKIDYIDIPVADIPANILVIDDEDIVRTIITDALHNKGLNIYSFANPLEAVRYFKKNHKSIDLIILDMMMPLLSGEDTFKNLIEIDPNAAVIILSGYYSEVKVKEMLTNGVLGYLEKPISIDKLTLTVFNSLEKIGKGTTSYIDKATALSSLNNNEKIYNNLLTRYLQEYENASQLVSEYLEAKQYERIRELVHKIKGISLNIGSEKLLEITQRLEKDIVSNQPAEVINDQVQLFVDFHTNLINNIKNML